MAKKKTPPKNETLEALDFVVNVLKEHENDLDRLINELGTVMASFGKSGEMTERVERVEERLTTLQNEIAGLIKFLSSPSQRTWGAPPPPPTKTTRTPALQPSPITRPVSTPPSITRAPVIVRCRQWNDFKTMAKGADTVSFLFREAEKNFQADALKDGRVLTYSGDLPKDTSLLKMWLARELEIAEETIFEGILAIG
jgi:hypothetical protein